MPAVTGWLIDRSAGCRAKCPASAAVQTASACQNARLVIQQNTRNIKERSAAASPRAGRLSLTRFLRFSLLRLSSGSATNDTRKNAVKRSAATALRVSWCHKCILLWSLALGLLTSDGLKFNVNSEQQRRRQQRPLATFAPDAQKVIMRQSIWTRFGGFVHTTGFTKCFLIRSNRDNLRWDMINLRIYFDFKSTLI